MTAIALAEYARDEALQPLLARYRDEACREVMAANRPRLLSIAKSIQPAVKAALTEIPASTGREDSHD